jgi:hypothetical protein
MPRATTPKKTVTKKVSVKKSKVISINFQKPGATPTTEKVEVGVTAQQFIEQFNCKGYTVSLNGSSSFDKNVVLSDGDIIRIGLKTKNA